MTIEFVSGDLLNPMKEDAIAHGCNCLGSMGAGIAKEIRDRWPFDMTKAYKRLCSEGWEYPLLGIPNNPIKPGDVQYLKYKNFPLLINMFTQKDIWTQKDGSPPAKLEWIKKCIENIVDTVVTSKVRTIGVPRIGAGLGGLRWEDVKALMIEICEPVENLHFVVYEHYIQGK